MKKPILAIFIFLSFILTSSYFVSEGFAEKINFTKSESGLKSQESSKVNPLINEWKNSLEAQLFASENDLQYSDGKIRVYLYLDDTASVSKLPTNIDIVSSSDNIVVANIDGRQVTQLSQLDFVQRIELPLSGTLMAEPKSQKTIPDDYSEKIAEVIQKWQTSQDPPTFASENDLQYSDGKIRVYLYLDDTASVSKLPTNIDIVSSSDNIVSTTLDSAEINQLSQLDFVQRIEPPVSGIFGPPQIFEGESVNEIYLYSIIGIIIAAIIVGIVFIARRKIAKKI